MSRSADYRVRAVGTLSRQASSGDRASRDLHVVDYFNARSAAEYAARQLFAGAALIDPHAVVGCRVVAA